MSLPESRVDEISSTSELKPSRDSAEGTVDRLNEAPQYILVVSELSLLQLNATRTFLQSVGLQCAVENYRDPLRDGQPGLAVE